MDISVKVMALLSLLIFVGAAWIGFVDIKDPNVLANRLSAWIKRKFKWSWLQQKYILTRVGLLVGLILGIVSIIIS
jgi:hypothetical protein